MWTYPFALSMGPSGSGKNCGGGPFGFVESATARIWLSVLLATAMVFVMVGLMVRVMFVVMFFSPRPSLSPRCLTFPRILSV
jgi:hypothetical protein